MHTNANTRSTCNPHVATSFYHKRPTWERVYCPIKACSPPTSSYSLPEYHRCRSYPKLHSECTFYFRYIRLRGPGMGKRCICLQGTERQEEQKIIEEMHGYSLPFPFTPPLCCGRAGETKELSTFKRLK